MNHTEDKIIGILNGNELDSSSIKEKLGLTYDTTAKYLKTMTEKGIVERTAKGSPWTYQYRLKSVRSEK